MDLQAYADSLSGAPATRIRALSAVKSLLAFGQRTGYLVLNVSDLLVAPPPGMTPYLPVVPLAYFPDQVLVVPDAAASLQQLPSLRPPSMAVVEGAAPSTPLSPGDAVSELIVE